jgi:hypothetical protein
MNYKPGTQSVRTGLRTMKKIRFIAWICRRYVGWGQRFPLFGLEIAEENAVVDPGRGHVSAVRRASESGMFSVGTPRGAISTWPAPYACCEGALVRSWPWASV